MQHIQESGERIARNISNLRLLHQCLVEEVCSILLFPLFFFLVFFALFLFDSSSRDIESHLDKLIWARTSLPATAGACAVRLGICGESKLDSDFILSGKVGVGDFGIWNLERRTVLNVERELGLGEFGLAPVPSTK